jgi:Flp pilus assembly pilin Flp
MPRVRFILYDVSIIFRGRTTWLRHESGQTLAEYGILLGVIALVVVAVAVLLGSSISQLFSSAGHHL